MKKFLFALLAALSLTAARADFSGSIGTNTGIFYEYYTSSGLLKIFRDDSYPSFSGVMPNYDYGDVPWASVRNNIQKITIEEGITNLGNQVFFKHTSVTSISLPSSLTSIGTNAFAGCTALESVTLPGSLTGIDNGVFEGCTSLRSVSLPSTMTSIGTNVFKGCTALESITLPGSLTSIGASAFAGCTALESITFPSSLTGIDDGAFEGCTSLESVTLPGSLTSIDNGAFDGCTSLRSVSLPSTMTSIGTNVFRGCTALNSITLPSSLTSIGEGAFRGCEGLTTLTIPNKVEVIGKEAFYGCSNITSLTLGSNLREIGEGAFRRLEGLTTLTIPDKVEVIRTLAFSLCNHITSLTLGSNLREIGEQAFLGCDSLTTLTIPNKVEVIGKQAFYGCNHITSLTLGSNLREIGEGAFSYCGGLTTLTIPDKVEVIGKDAFFGCNLITSLTLGSNLREIGEKAFFIYEGLTTLTIPDRVEVIGAYAFFGCKNITSLTLGSNLREIGEAAFRGCESLTTLIIPERVTNIHEKAFWGCEGMTDIYCHANPDLLTWTIKGFKANNETRLHVFDIDYNAGKWNSFIENGAEVTIVGDIIVLTITFNTGGKGTVPESQKLWLGKLATEPPLQLIGEAGSEEYLEGWYTNQALTQSFDFTVAPNQTMTLYAKWATAAKVDFNVINPEGGTCTLTDAKGRVLDHGPAIPGNCILTVTPKEGYNYSGSYTLEHRTDHTSFMPTQISGDNERSYNVNLTQYDLTVNVSFVALPIATVTVKDNGIATGYSYTLQYGSGQDCPNGSVIAHILENPNDPGASWDPNNTLCLTINGGTDDSQCVGTICNNGTITEIKSYQTTYDIIPEGSVDITLFFYDSGKNLVLSDNGDNNSTLAAIYRYHSFWNVTLQGRTLYRDGCWNTLCLPFYVPDFNGTPLENADVRELTAASLDGTTLTLNFRAATDIEFGKPYIVKWPIDADIVNPVFTGVMIDSYYQLREANFGTVSFRGTYTGHTFTDENPNILFMGANNNLYYPLAGATIGAQRAYFQLASGVSANNFVLTFDDDDEEPSAIASEIVNGQSSMVNAEGVASGQRERSGNGQWFDLQGRKVQNPQKGNIYIRGRKKIIY
ncbi:MAG: leucine-rich repeat protein [Bacteroidaceae bacterium]|nr:leucine-rich repeat protein [Bacteroidaceae bacterium]